MDFIVDRTSEDVMYAQSFIGAIWSKMSNEQKEEWLRGMQTGQTLNGLKGFFNYTDMARIKLNYNDLRTAYSYTGQDEISTTYNMSVIPNRSVMSADFNKILQFGIAKLPYFYNASYSDYRTLDLSTDVNRIDYNFVNNYEHILKNLYDLKTNGELIMECEFLGTNSYELDGYILGKSGDELGIKIPSGYIATREVGSISGEFTPAQTTTWATNGEVVTQELSGENLYATLKIAGGIQKISGDGRDNRNIENLTPFSKISFDNEPIEIEYPYTTYTATEVQSDFISTNDKEYIWFCNASNTSGRIIVTFYDENEDVLDEYAITEDTLLMCNGASYFTIDSEVGDSIKYARQTDLTQTWNGFGIANDTSTFLGAIHSGTSFDISQYDAFHISRSTTSVNNNAIILGTVSVENGEDISQLDLSEIEVKYID